MTSNQGEYAVFKKHPVAAEALGVTREMCADIKDWYSDHVKLGYTVIRQWASEHVQTIELPDGKDSRRFKVVADQADDPDAPLLVVTAEAGAGTGTRNWDPLSRARMVRDIVFPKGAGLLYVPNSTLGNNNPNFSRSERQQIAQGSAAPFVRRLEAAMGDRAGKITTIWGASQGAIGAAAYGASLNTPSEVALAITEPVGILPRSVREVGAAFVKHGGDYWKTIESNFQTSDDPYLKMLREKSAPIEFFAGLVRRDAFAAVRYQGSSNTADHIVEAVAKGVAVVHVYGGQSHVSPPEANRAIGDRIGRQENHRSIEVEKGDHSVSNQWPITAATVSLATLLRAQ